jgi:hypothetical protein
MRTRPVVDRLEGEFGGRVQFMRYNIDDPASDTAKRAYKFRAQPQIVIINPAGTIIVSRLSELTYTRLKADLEQVLRE